MGDDQRKTIRTTHSGMTNEHTKDLTRAMGFKTARRKCEG